MGREGYVQSAVCYLVGAVEEEGEEEGGDLVGALLFELVAVGDIEEGGAGRGVLGEEGADLGKLARAPAVLEGVEVTARCAGAGTFPPRGMVVRPPLGGGGWGLAPASPFGPQMDADGHRLRF
jgi:hypothetical protein